MKKYLLFAAAALLFAGCSSDDIVSDVTSPVQEGSNTIAFSSVYKGATRADHVGADAAALLNSKFVVGGFKGAGDVTATVTSTGTVFDNYIVNWAENTAATTASNTSDWEYVGITAAAPSGIKGNTQSIKYWDYSAAQYDFIAYSTGTATAVTGTPGAGEIKVTAIDPENAKTAAYTLTGTADDLQKCYIADMVTVYKSSGNYGKEVQLTFRALASKVRMAIYETVPGYSVKDVKFYTDASTTIATGASQTNATLFTTGSATKDNFYTGGTYTVSFPTIGSTNTGKTDYNKAHVALSDATKGTTKGFGTLNLVGKDYMEADATNYIGRTSATASFAGTTAPYYAIAMPNEEGTVLELRVDYTLLSIDGSGEEIKVHGATAYVPAIYAAWKPNYAYTYIFKISDNTNGWTSTVTEDPAGLYPITFDAVVAETEDYTQSTITTVATPSITTYQKGHDVTKDEYAATDGDIYVQVMKEGNLKSDLDYKGKLYSLSTRTNPWTEAEVMDALNIRASENTTTITGRNGLTLTTVSHPLGITTIPGADGNIITVTAGTAAKFTPTAGTTYAYVYDDTPTPAPAASYYYSAEKYTSQPSDFTTLGIYYEDPEGTKDVAATPAATFSTDTYYYKKYTNLNNVYGVKVIKVQ